MSTITMDNSYTAPPCPPLVPLPVWVRGILFNVSSAAKPSLPLNIDHEDVAAARRGDGEAYARIIRRHQAGIAKQMSRFSIDRTIVEELVHDCFVEAYLSLRSFRGDAPLTHWLSKIAVRVGYRHWKIRRRQRDMLSKLQAGSAFLPESAATAADSKELAGYLLDQLSPRDRLALTLLYIEGRSVAEAAELAGWSQTMLKVQAYRARKKLRTILEAQGIQHG